MPTDYSKPINKFKQQRRQAKQRDISWQMTFEEWISVWQESGKWEQRGKRNGEYVMARQGDVGPYSVGNVYICLATENHSHAHSNGRVPIRPRTRPARVRRETKGWTLLSGRKKPYQVMYGRRYIGVFETQEQAEAAHRSAVASCGIRCHQQPLVSVN